MASAGVLQGTLSKQHVHDLILTHARLMAERQKPHEFELMLSATMQNQNNFTDETVMSSGNGPKRPSRQSDVLETRTLVMT
ncbi:hypothetical protein OPT61_g9045 [Boeremia exigua]|uniref:Uncharacterized protein n=1 Tax=Boeremia exigua TaxID=749465 RepID=A0ACC2HXE1_9PLEO|nr:hypothetical protein OPT61_g9045 [Boeremia exigua]